LKLIAELFRHSSRQILFAIVAGLVGGLSGAGLVALIGRALTDGTSRLDWLAVGFFTLCATTLAARSLSEIILLRLTQDLVLRLRLSLSQRLVQTPLLKLHQLGKAELLAILTQDVEKFVQTANLLPVAFVNCIVIVACLGYLATISFMLFVVFAACLVSGSAAFHLLERRPIRQLMAARSQTDALYRHFRSLVEGSKELQLNASRAENFVFGLIAPTARQFRAALVRALSAYTWVVNTGSVLFYVVVGVITFILPLALPLSPEIRITSALVLLYLAEPLTTLLAAIPHLRQADISLQRIQQLGNTLGPTEQTVVDSDPFASVDPLHIVIRGVCHRFPGLPEDATFMLGPIDLSINQGEVVFVVGGNGSGKTTFAMLVLGLFQPQGGCIELNGVPVTPSNVAHYRARFSAVFADFHLFEHLLNSDEQMVAARGHYYLDALGMSEKVTIDQGRFSTIELSSGQRRRLALVAAYLEDRMVYFFDEWAADQDPTFRHIFYTELLAELKQRGKTMIVITHDDRYFGYADRIIRLDRGRLLAPTAGTVETADAR
jgi:putative ATP-binding cassette transporter